MLARSGQVPGTSFQLRAGRCQMPDVRCQMPSAGSERVLRAAVLGIAKGPEVRRPCVPSGPQSWRNRMAAYTGLVAWQRGMDLVVEVYEFTSTLPKEERYGLCAKLQRAAVSIPSNIAEGNSRRRRGAYINHSSIAIGSQAEVETLLQLCTRLHFGDPTPEVGEFLLCSLSCPNYPVR